MNFQPPLLGLDLAPTVAMKAGRQRVWQCLQCGLVAVQSDLAPGAMGECPPVETANGGSRHFPWLVCRTPQHPPKESHDER